MDTILVSPDSEIPERSRVLYPVPTSKGIIPTMPFVPNEEKKADTECVDRSSKYYKLT